MLDGMNVANTLYVSPYISGYDFQADTVCAVTSCSRWWKLVHYDNNSIIIYFNLSDYASHTDNTVHRLPMYFVAYSVLCTAAILYDLPIRGKSD